MKVVVKNFIAQIDRFGEKISEEGLIKFDRKVIILFLFSIFTFLLLVLFKIHGSSIPYWNKMIPEGKDREGIILGNPRSIRSDEWLVLTPFILSQSKKGFPVENKNLGANKDPLLLNLPVKHFSAFFRPQNWGYFFLDVERGYSFFWNFKVFGLFLSSFLLFMILTRNNFTLSVFGSLWVYFSGFLQWWFSIPLPEIIISFNIIFISLLYILFSQKRWQIYLGALFFIIFSLNFAFFFYPPFQIPLAYLSLFLLAGLFLQREYFEKFKKEQLFRVIIAFVSTLAVIFFLYLYYIDAKETMQAVLNTVYPGKRVSLGGDVKLTKLFSGFTGLPLGETGLPSVFVNASEGSNFILLFPVIILLVFRNFILDIKNNPLVVALSFYLLGFTSWVLVKFPHLFAKLSLLSFVTSKRAILGIGLASIMATVIFLSDKKNYKGTDKRFVYLISIFVFTGLLLYGFSLKAMDPEFFKIRYLFVIAFAFTVTSYFLITKKKLLFALSILAILLATTSYVNPVSFGLKPIYDKETSQIIPKYLKDDESKAIVFGNHLFANFLKASGANVFNGVKYTPDIDAFSILDPEKKFSFVYNRYAHIGATEASSKEANIVLTQTDSFVIEINSCSERLKEIGITHAIFTNKPKAESVRCMEFVDSAPENNVWLYKYR